MPPGPVEAAVAKLVREMESWSSIKIELTRRGVNHVPRPGSLKEHVQSVSYIETSRGERMLDVLAPLPGGATSRMAAFCDGDRCAKVGYRGSSRQDGITISRSFLNEGVSGSTDRPIPLNMLYVGKIPLHEALPKGKFLGRGVVEDKQTLIFAFPRVKWSMAVQDLVYELDEASAIPVRVRSYLGNFDASRLEDFNPVWTWTAKSVEVVQGYHMPMRSELVEFDRDASGACTRNPRDTVEVSVKTLQYNAKFPKSTFWPVYQPGTQVIDGIKKSDYVVPGGHATGEDATDLAAVSSVPVQATRPGQWTDWLASGSLALGVVLLTTRICRFSLRRR